MKIVIAPDSFKDNLDSEEVCLALKQGILTGDPSIDVVTIPLADGGEGTANIITKNANGQLIEVQVTGPLGTPVSTHYGLISNGTIAVLDMASASGLSLVPPEERNPLKTSTFGTGELIRAALNSNVKHIIIGIGGSATNDGGTGMLSALGFRFLDMDGNELLCCGNALSLIESIDCSKVDPRLEQVKFEIACDVTNPLIGPLGASAVFGPQKGATPEMVAKLDAGLKHLQDVWVREGFLASPTSSSSAPPSSSPSSTWPRRRVPLSCPGDGAAGGLGAALRVCLGAEMRPGASLVLAHSLFFSAAPSADLVVTCEGRTDAQTAHGKLCMAVAKACRSLSPPVPVVLISGCVEGDVMGMLDLFASVQSIACGEEGLDEMIKNSRRDLVLAGANLARVLALGKAIGEKK